MPAALDFTKFAFDTEEIRAINQLAFDEVVKSPEIQNLVTFYPGIVYDKEIGFVGRGGLVGKASQGCNPTADAWSISTRKVKWTPKQWSIRIEQCAKDLESTAAVYSLKTGTSYDDFTASDYMNVVLEVLAQSMKEFIIRFVFFNDTTEKTFADGGQLKNGLDIAYFTINDGIFKQAQIQITANADQRVTITENAGASYAAQKLVAANVKDTYLPSLVDNADDRIAQMGNVAIFCTNSFYKAYKASLRGIQLESALALLQNGVKTLTYDGVPLLPIPTWDLIINAYYNNGTKRVNPHRALYVSKDIIAFGVDSESSYSDFDVFYDKKSKLNIIDVEGKGDSKILNPELFMLAI